jgi:hypothetical protein
VKLRQNSLKSGLVAGSDEMEKPARPAIQADLPGLANWISQRLFVRGEIRVPNRSGSLYTLCLTAPGRSAFDSSQAGCRARIRNRVEPLHEDIWQCFRMTATMLAMPWLMTRFYRNCHVFFLLKSKPLLGRDDGRSCRAQRQNLSAILAY